MKLMIFKKPTATRSGKFILPGRILYTRGLDDGTSQMLMQWTDKVSQRTEDKLAKVTLRLCRLDDWINSMLAGRLEEHIWFGEKDGTNVPG